MGDFDSVYKEYFSDVYRYTLSLSQNPQDAEDITAETFIRAMRALPNFRGECELRVWLCRIAKNLWLTEARKRGRFSDGDAEIADTPDESSFEANLADKQQSLCVHRALHSLNEPYKEVFSLRVFGELSFGDIGALFSKSEHWACVTYHRAKEKIQKEMISLDK